MTRLIRWARTVGLALIFMLAPVAAASSAAADEPPAGHVYVQTNSAQGNSVVSFARGADGSLTFEETLDTGGLGTSAGLGDQASIAITADGRHLLVTNGGSDDVSLLDITEDGLELADVQPVGDLPVSVAVHGNLVYVLNQGADSIQAVRISDEDSLVGIPNSTRPLSGQGVGAAQVAFSPNGRLLAVTEKATSTIDTYVVRPNGRAVGPNVQPSSGITPFGFQFGPDGRLYVSEAPDSAASSYDVDAAGVLTEISPSVPNLQAAACWLVVTSDGRFAYTANAGSANVSRYAIGSDGSLSLAAGAAGATDPGPVDLDVSDGDGYLYVLNSRSGSISAFELDPSNGSLTSIPGASGIGTGFAGLIAV